MSSAPSSTPRQAPMQHHPDFLNTPIPASKPVPEPHSTSLTSITLPTWHSHAPICPITPNPECKFLQFLPNSYPPNPPNRHALCHTSPQYGAQSHPTRPLNPARSARRTSQPPPLPSRLAARPLGRPPPPDARADGDPVPHRPVRRRRPACDRHQPDPHRRRGPRAPTRLSDRLPRRRIRTAPSESPHPPRITTPDRGHQTKPNRTRRHA